MKRYNKFAAILAFAVFALLSSQAYLQTVDNGTPVRPAFVDENGDGICDNYDGGQRRGLGQGTRANFVDADGDGVCDNMGTRSGNFELPAGFWAKRRDVPDKLVSFLLIHRWRSFRELEMIR